MPECVIRMRSAVNVLPATFIRLALHVVSPYNTSERDARPFFFILVSLSIAFLSLTADMIDHNCDVFEEIASLRQYYPE